MAEASRKTATLDGTITKKGMGIVEGLPLEVAGDSPEDLSRALQHLMDIEAIKKLKHSYFRCIDTANFEELSTLFHEDVLVHFVGGSYEWKLEGRDEYLASIRNSFNRESIGHHNGHHPEIQILDEKEATGIWYLSDNMWVFNFNFFTTGTAIYWDRYVKQDGRWLIRETRYERIYEINEAIEERPQLSTHYLARHGTPLPQSEE
ncbi:MAG: nuclear transport factor 2 family protein [Myxococcota bacterium]|nr:nuclear transport factor 2 family protein [Myxococcota bacterium]